MTTPTVTASPTLDVVYSVRYTREYSGDVGEGVIEAHIDGNLVGVLRWDIISEDPTVIEIDVEEGYRRRGIATAMFDEARRHESTLQHSDVLTDDGRAFRAACESRRSYT